MSNHSPSWARLNLGKSLSWYFILTLIKKVRGLSAPLAHTIKKRNVYALPTAFSMVHKHRSRSYPGVLVKNRSPVGLRLSGTPQAFFGLEKRKGIKNGKEEKSSVGICTPRIRLPQAWFVSYDPYSTGFAPS